MRSSCAVASGAGASARSKVGMVGPHRKGVAARARGEGKAQGRKMKGREDAKKHVTSRGTKSRHPLRHFEIRRFFPGGQ